jgi:O-6-methylguanine DNA methyltransferase
MSFQSSRGCNDAHPSRVPPYDMIDTITTTAALVPLRTARGSFEAAFTNRGVCCLMFPNQLGAATRWLGRHLPGARIGTHDPRSEGLSEALDAYFNGDLTEFTVPLDLVGTPFQLEVWRQLRAIPYGEVRSYADVARAVGRPDAVRAVGAANGANPVPIMVPCHRVIGSNGALTGFGGGLDWKRRLLATENSAGWSSPGVSPRGPANGSRLQNRPVSPDEGEASLAPTGSA